MDYRGKTICILPSEKILNVLGKKYTLLIIALLGNQKRVKFNDIMKKTGCPRPNLLSIRLRELEELGLIKKRIMGENRPLSVEYMLTRDGKKLRSLIIPILAWIEENSKN
ncbi:MAG: transcriptional regulator [Euryarchaeota archaeon]|nr:transcriptional regulator [Euryarchaeota archaeon]